MTLQIVCTLILGAMFVIQTNNRNFEKVFTRFAKISTEFSRIFTTSKLLVIAVTSLPPTQWFNLLLFCGFEKDQVKEKV